MQIKCLAQGHDILMPGFEPYTSVTTNRHFNQMINMIVIIIIIIMVIFKCYFSGENIALSIKKKKLKNNNNGVNIELGKTNRLKALCMMQINT